MIRGILLFLGVSLGHPTMTTQQAAHYAKLQADIDLYSREIRLGYRNNVEGPQFDGLYVWPGNDWVTFVTPDEYKIMADLHNDTLKLWTNNGYVVYVWTGAPKGWVQR